MLDRLDTLKNRIFLVIAIFLSVFSGQIFAEGDVSLSAKQIRPGCSVVMHPIGPLNRVTPHAPPRDTPETATPRATAAVNAV